MFPSYIYIYIYIYSLPEADGPCQRIIISSTTIIVTIAITMNINDRGKHVYIYIYIYTLPEADGPCLVRPKCCHNSNDTNTNTDTNNN